MYGITMFFTAAAFGWLLKLGRGKTAAPEEQAEAVHS